ncbi:MAG: nucleotidyltransferase family protein [Gammaproteobacteria bacterium]|nr:nucleotidyltransferase family protein [Gammaproteobacteria bacterium]
MRAMILAAGLGRRMGPVTQHTPKPLLKVGTHYLIEYSIASLQRAEITEIVINVSHHAEQIKMLIGNGSKYGVDIIYSEEATRLETGGGILKALPLLGKDPFIVLSADVLTEYPLSQLPKAPNGLAHIVLVPNPPFHPLGDFGLEGEFASLKNSPFYTYANIGIYRHELFADVEPGVFPLSQLLIPAIKTRHITAELFTGTWHNIGTQDDLKIFNAAKKSNLLSLV